MGLRSKAAALAATILVGATALSGSAAADAPYLDCISVTPGARDRASVRIGTPPIPLSKLSANVALSACGDTWTAWPDLNAAYNHAQVTDGTISLHLKDGTAACTGPGEWANATVNVNLGRIALGGTRTLKVNSRGIATTTGDLGSPGGATLHFVGINRYSRSAADRTTGIGGTLDLTATVTLTEPCTATLTPIDAQLTNVVVHVAPLI